MIKELNDIAKECYEAARDNGWYNNDDGTEKDINFGERCMLIVTEVAEAVDADRKHRFAENVETVISSPDFKEKFEDNIKGSLEDEIADIIIRVMDMCGYMNIDIGTHVALKLKYNKTRGYKHGGRKY